VSEQLLSFRDATEIVWDRLNVSPDKARIRLIEAIASGKVHVTIDPKCEQQLVDAATTRDRLYARPDDAFDGALAPLCESAAQGALAHSVLTLCGQVRQDTLVNWLDSISEPKLRRASAAVIREEVRAVYADPATDRPNIKQLPKHVLPRLRDRGFEASGREIQKIGDEPEFKNLRPKQGFRKRTSQAG
jgi:hypothetical protein